MSQSAFRLKGPAAILGIVFGGTGSATAVGARASLGLEYDQDVETPLPVGVMRPHPSTSAPTDWLACDGSAVSRATYAALFAALSISTTGDFTNTNPVVINIPSTTGMKAGMPLSGTRIAASTTILTVDSATQITMSAGATSTGATTAFVVAPFGVGDGSTTFNLPKTGGRTMLGASANRLGATDGLEDVTLSVVESGIKSHNHDNLTTGYQDTYHTHGLTISGQASSPYHKHGQRSVGLTTNNLNYSVIGDTTTQTSGFSQNHTHYLSSCGTESASHNHACTVAASSSAAASSSHTNMSPWLAMPTVIKYQ